MNIKITQSNNQKISDALNLLNGKSLAHTFSAPDIFFVADRAEVALAALVPKKYRSGAVAVARSGDALPNSYKYSRLVNRVTIERRSSHWYLMGLECYQAYKDGAYLRLRLTQAQDTVSVQLHRSAYSVQEVTA